VKPLVSSLRQSPNSLAREKANVALGCPDIPSAFNGLHTENAGIIASQYLSGIALPVVRSFGTSQEPVVKQKCFEWFKTNVCLTLI